MNEFAGFTPKYIVAVERKVVERVANTED